MDRQIAVLVVMFSNQDFRVIALYKSGYQSVPMRIYRSKRGAMLAAGRAVQMQPMPVFFISQEAT